MSIRSCTRRRPNSIRLGRDIRVGLEDATVLADSRVASGNGELVEAAVRLAAEAGRPL